MKITCNIIEDLMQQYVDGVLSDDSRQLVEEHLDGCEECRQKEQQIRSICRELDEAAKAGAVPEARQDYGSLRRFRRWITLRRALTITLSVLVTFCVVVGGVFLMFDLESYMPYQKTGMHVNENGMMFMDEPYYGYRGAYSGIDLNGDMIEIFYMTDTFQKRHLGKPTRGHVVDFGVEDQGTRTNEECVREKIPPIDKLYYLKEEYVKEKHLKDPFDSHASLIPLDAGKEEELRIVNEIENDSILVWERSK